MDAPTRYRCFECPNFKTTKVSRYVLHTEKHEKVEEQLNYAINHTVIYHFKTEYKLESFASFLHSSITTIKSFGIYNIIFILGINATFFYVFLYALTHRSL